MNVGGYLKDADGSCVTISESGNDGYKMKKGKGECDRRMNKLLPFLNNRARVGILSLRYTRNVLCRTNDVLRKKAEIDGKIDSSIFKKVQVKSSRRCNSRKTDVIICIISATRISLLSLDTNVDKRR